MLAAGSLDTRITLQQRIGTIDALGQPTESWIDLVTVGASVSPLRGREYFAAGQIESVVDVRIRIRYRSNITTAMRVVWQSTPYDIISVIDVDARRHTLELMCATGAKDSR